ncbi:MAG: hypothetical protein ACXWL2_03905 [Candidatus Chromulinivorax sp.]
MLKYIFLFLFLIPSTCFSVIKVTIDETNYTTDEICTKIQLEKENPKMITWYVGESGITQTGAQFYQDSVFNKFKTVTTPHKFYLYDLVAWQGLRNRQSSIAGKSKIAEHINTLNNPHYSSIHSSEFLQDILQENDEDIIKYTQDTILRNPHLYIHSAGRRETGIKLKEVLPARALEPIHELDTTHTYAALQYLEGIFLTKKIAQHPSSAPKENVIFFLPNDEYKYYVSEQIEADMNNMLQSKIPTDKDIDVTFNCFKFGSSIQERPYILRDKKATKQNITDLLK